MGLDIYTYTAKEAESNAAYDAAEERLWAEYSDLYETDKAAFDAKEAEIVGDMDYTSNQDVPSEKYPDHLFNRRYLRSSYNGSGFDQFVPLATSNPKNTLEGIFEGTPWIGEEDDTYPGGWLDKTAIPHLKDKVIPRALAAAQEIRDSDEFTTTFISRNPFIPATEYPRTEQDALARAREILSKPSGAFESFTSREGTFFTKGMEVFAAIPGTSAFGSEGVYLVFKSEAVESYIESAEIVAEFAQELIDLIETDGKAYVSWSG